MANGDCTVADGPRLFDERDESASATAATPTETFDDLGIEGVITVICAGRNDAAALKAMFARPCTAVEDVHSRQRVWRAYRIAPIGGILDDFAGAIRRMRSASERQSSERDNTRRQFMWLQAITAFVHDIDGVVDRIAQVQAGCGEVRDVLDAITRFADTRNYLTMKAQAESIALELAALRFDLEIQDDTLTVGGITVGESEPREDLKAQIIQLGAVFSTQWEAPRSADVMARTGAGANPMDSIVVELVRRQFPEPFQRLSQFVQACTDIVPAWMIDVARQIDFLAAWRSFVDGLSTQGLTFCLPDVESYDIRRADVSPSDTRPAEGRSFDCKKEPQPGVRGRHTVPPRETHTHHGETVDGLFNVELAMTRHGAGTPIVTNSYRLTGEERIVVVTGANQGGKTTFARAVGQLHYFASLGLPVPASRASIRFTPLVLSAFATDERFEAGRGRFEDDLMKMKAVTSRMVPDALIVANEMFASTTSYDAVAVSNRILGLIRECGCLCVWVTFLSELAEPPAVSMVAQVSAGDDERRTFQILRKPADGRAHAISLLSAHHLTSHEISERMGR